MKICILFLALSFSISAEEIRIPINQLTQALAEPAPAIDYTSNCSTCPQIATYPTDTITSPSTKQVVTLSVLSEEKVQFIFNKLAARKDIPFDYPKDGCFARAHKMAMLMDEEGIISGKAFFQGKILIQSKNGPVVWTYHVVSTVLVNVNGKNELYILDPSIYDRPVPISLFKNDLSKSKMSRLMPEYYTNRFSYDLLDKNQQYDNYNPGSIASMNSELKKYSDMIPK